MRGYSIKKGHKPDLHAILKNHFGVDGDVEQGMDFVANGIGKVHIKRDKSVLIIDTEPVAGVSGSVDIIKNWNDFLFEVTGRTSKERKKLMEKEAKKK